MMTRRALADAIDDLDEQISVLQATKAETFGAYREQLKTTGHAKDAVKLEMEATKAAIRQRRKLAEDAMAVEEKDALVDEILAEIRRVDKSLGMKHARASAPAREEAA